MHNFERGDKLLLLLHTVGRTDRQTKAGKTRNRPHRTNRMRWAGDQTGIQRHTVGSVCKKVNSHISFWIWIQDFFYYRMIILNFETKIEVLKIINIKTNKNKIVYSAYFFSQFVPLCGAWATHWNWQNNDATLRCNAACLCASCSIPLFLLALSSSCQAQLLFSFSLLLFCSFATFINSLP